MPARQLAENAVCPCEFMPRCPRPVAEWSGASTKIPSSAAPSKPPPKPITYNSRCDPTTPEDATPLPPRCDPTAPKMRPHCLDPTALRSDRSRATLRGEGILPLRPEGVPPSMVLPASKDRRGSKRPPSRGRQRLGLVGCASHTACSALVRLSGFICLRASAAAPVQNRWCAMHTLRDFRVGYAYELDGLHHG